MAIIKAAQSGNSLGRIMNYVDKKAELTSGLNVSDDKQTAMLEMQQTKEMYNKTDGRQYKHYIQSFSPKDNNKLTPEKVHELGCEWANEHFKGFEVFITTHTDREHLHNHFVVNSVSFEDGHKFQVGNKELNYMKEHSNSICEREGLYVPAKLPSMDGEIRTFDMRKYQLMKRVAEGQHVKSYVIDTALAVEKSKINSNSRDEFINSMKEKGYSTKWQDNIKHVTFEDQEGNKVRLSNLEKTFNDNSFTKEGLDDEFSRNQRSKGARTRNKSGEDHESHIGHSISENEPVGSGIDESRKRAAQADITELHKKLSEIRGLDTQFDPDEQRRIDEAAKRAEHEATKQSEGVTDKQPNVKSKHPSRNKDFNIGYNR